MRNSKAKKNPFREVELYFRRVGRERTKTNEKVKQMATGQLTALGEPVTIPYSTHTAVNVNNSYKQFKREGK